MPKTIKKNGTSESEILKSKPPYNRIARKSPEPPKRKLIQKKATTKPAPKCPPAHKPAI